MATLCFSLHARPQLPDRDPVRRLDAAPDQIARRIRLQLLCGVIRRLCSLLLDELDAAPVDDHEITVLFADDDKGCPA